MKNAIWLSVVVLSALATGCGSSNESASPAQAQSAPAAESSAADDDGIGVAECDDYLRKVEICIEEHVPEEAQAMQQQNMAQMRDQWRQAASNPTAKAGLAAGCKAALDAARSSMTAYGCEW